MASQLKNKRQQEKHGKHLTKEYRAWAHMKSRCYDPKLKSYKDYGGRGIKVCKRWLNSFVNFYEDMGPKPTEKHSLDRIDCNADYSPSNCRWATWYTQSTNKRKKTSVSGKQTTSKYIGVRRQHKKFDSRIRVNGKRIILGYFRTEIEAALAYNEAVIKYRGEGSVMNIIEGDKQNETKSK